MIQETVDKVVQFIGQNNYFQAYENNHDYFILNKLGEEVRLKYINAGTFQPLLIPENLKFYLGGLDD